MKTKMKTKYTNFITGKEDVSQTRCPPSAVFSGGGAVVAGGRKSKHAVNGMNTPTQGRM